MTTIDAAPLDVSTHTNAEIAGRANPPASDETARLLISCTDRPGIVAAVSSFLFLHGANILRSDQHSTDPSGGRFFMRMEFALPGLRSVRHDLERSFEREVGRPFGMTWRVGYSHTPKRVAIMVSREGHCLLDLLWRWRNGELDAEVTCVISNHPDLRGEVQRFGVPYFHVPTPRGTRAEAERRILGHLAGRSDLLILARYMQILTGDFLERLGAPAINIHHSFLPAFPGADPYARARERGVKLVGATAHYVTEELDAGPIIEQEVLRTDHRLSVAELTRKGADVERLALARAVSWHLEDRILVDGPRTIVF